MTDTQADLTEHAKMIAAVNEAIEGAEMEAQGYRNGASISDGDERLLREAEDYQRRADTLRAVLAHLEPTDTQADLTERARALVQEFRAYLCNLMIDLDEPEIAWMTEKLAAAIQSERETAAAEARRAERKLIAEWLDRNRHHDIADTLMRNASPPAPQEETR